MDYVARLCGDFLHITAKTLLLGRIVSARSGTGFSFQTQALYLLVFLARYLDVFTTFVSYYNTVVKLFYIATSLATVAYMWFVCRDTWEEAEKRTPNVGALLFASLAMAVAWNYQFTLLEVAWSFSIVLESVAIFPQLVVSSFAVTDPYVLAYLATLGSYRFLYIVNWVVRWRTQNYIDPIAFTFGAIQELVYLGALYAWLKRRQVRVSTFLLRGV
ncbi:ER lumen protein retaining receptor 3-like protein [Gonapodya prolifera JEL478]|uniref:ER lumen protein retaining receptor 3-like protein n=1 Tax=Gonapodya prolifera (strain JEL478) TaxID=1344416 RepID=A0A139A5B7_GONPJ|nr:ER lumen protein retaining receptor 3-like protein [Gonapodya prolifera JEL478]|eukprot:KXS11838.1 ER lumen protein retaining receptor 3-like protein [Gonapodya prolifera JEL478]